VLDVSTLFAGPMAAMHLGDLGAEVIKVEHPRRLDPGRAVPAPAGVRHARGGDERVRRADRGARRAAYAAAVRARRRRRVARDRVRRAGRAACARADRLGQVVDLAIIEPMLAMLGPQITRWDQLGTEQPRTGNRSANNAPRNTYRTSDGGWVAVSTSAQSIAGRVMRLVGKPEVISEPWFATGSGRAAHADALDDAVAAYDVARAHPRVASLGLGEADLRSDLGVDDDLGLAFARSRVVNAARAAGLAPPVMSAYLNVHDDDGLARSCAVGRGLWFVGRTAIHPRQLPVIVAAFLPTAEQVVRARLVLDAVARARAAGSGTVVLPDGTFLDVAMVERARRTVALGERR
jgi:hypothetical protein